MKTYFTTSFIFLMSFHLFSNDPSPIFIKGNDTLIAYSFIPNLTSFVPGIDINGQKDTANIRVISDKYAIRIRSAATNNVWVNILAHYTYNRGTEIEKLPLLSTGQPHSTNTQHYPNFTAGWSHTYGNFEMSNNHSVEVEISAVNGFKIKNLDFIKAKIHPSQKAGEATIINGKIYFTIDKPAQIVVDINGQMDDHNALINPIGKPVHTISIFANPILKKPTLDNPRTFYVENGIMPTSDPSTYDTVFFKAGVHDIGQNNKIYPGKVYYIPGDAIVFGSLNNKGVSKGNFTSTGERIKIIGYGTLSGVRQRHVLYVNLSHDHDIYKPIMIENARDYEIYGITVVDPSNHSVFIPSGQNGYVLWSKVIAWRANGDGLAGNLHVNDCFMRTSDDASYARGNRKRCTFWKDHISGFFYMSRIPNEEFLIEDCDIIYARSRQSNGWNGGVFNVRGDGTPVGQNKVNITFKNIRIHDPLSNMAIFNMVSYEGDNASAPTSVGCTYDGVVFKNISIKSSLVKQRMWGCAQAPWHGGITFDSVTFNETLLTKKNFTTYFDTNQFVKDLIFKPTGLFELTTNATNGGSIISKPGNSETTLILKAEPSCGYKFTHWSGDFSTSDNPLTIILNQNKNITANFTQINIGLNSHSRVEAEDYTFIFDAKSETSSGGGRNIGFIKNGSYIMFDSVNFNGGVTTFQARLASGGNGGSIEIRLDSLSGQIIGTCPIGPTGGWQKWITNSCLISNIKGVHKLYLKCVGGSGYLFNLDWFEFVNSNNSLSFDGLDDYVEIINCQTDQFQISNEFSIEYWFKGNSLNSAVSLFFDNENHIVSGMNGNHLIRINSNDYSTPFLNANDGEWHHIALTWQNNALNGFKYYLDGQLLSSFNTPNQIIPNILTKIMLGTNPNKDQFLLGSLDNVRIWSVSRTQTQIQENMYNHCSFEKVQPNLILYYSFDYGIENSSNSTISSIRNLSTLNNFQGLLKNFSLSNDISNFSNGTIQELNWKGSQDGNWLNRVNWECGQLPNKNSIVKIGANNTFYPNLHVNGEVLKLILNTGSTFVLPSASNFKILGKE